MLATPRTICATPTPTPITGRATAPSTPTEAGILSPRTASAVSLIPSQARPPLSGADTGLQVLLICLQHCTCPLLLHSFSSGMQQGRSRSAHTCAHALGKAFHAVFACHDHRCYEQRYSSAHYAFGCGLQTRTQSCLGIFRLPATWLGRSASSDKRYHTIVPVVLHAHTGTRRMTAQQLWLRVNLKLKTSLKSICASLSSIGACRLP